MHNLLFSKKSGIHLKKSRMRRGPQKAPGCPPITLPLTSAKTGSLQWLLTHSCLKVCFSAKIVQRIIYKCFPRANYFHSGSFRAYVGLSRKQGERLRSLQMGINLGVSLAFPPAMSSRVSVQWRQHGWFSTALHPNLGELLDTGTAADQVAGRWPSQVWST